MKLTRVHKNDSMTKAESGSGLNTPLAAKVSEIFLTNLKKILNYKYVLRIMKY